MAANATFALKPGVWFLRVRFVIFTPDSRREPSPPSGRKSTQPTVQILEASSAFPEINIPVVSVIWQYTGLTTPEMEQRVSTYSQYSISSNVTGIRDMEAQTLNGLVVQKIYFQPDVNLDLAIAQIVSGTNSIRALMPAGIEPPIVVAYNASSVPVLQLSLTSDRLDEQKLYDYGLYNLRQQLAPVPGVTFPTPDGGKYRQIMVDIDPVKLKPEV